MMRAKYKWERLRRWNGFVDRRDAIGDTLNGLAVLEDGAANNDEG